MELYNSLRQEENNKRGDKNQSFKNKYVLAEGYPWAMGTGWEGYKQIGMCKEGMGSPF